MFRTSRRVGLGASLVTASLLLAACGSSSSSAPEESPTDPMAKNAVAAKSKGYVVGIGDSYMSGEGGRWADNGPENETEGGWLVSKKWDEVYNSDGDMEPDTHKGGAMEGKTYTNCHRTQSAPSNVGAGYPHISFACSGAKTNTFSQTKYIPHAPDQPAKQYTVTKPGVNMAAGGQAAMLADFARDHDVTAVALSIGGNDMGFPELVAACVKAFTISLDQMCKDEDDVRALITKQKQQELANKIFGAFSDIDTAMSLAGKARDSWVLTYQSTPKVIPRDSKKVRESESKRWSADNQCGLALSDRDIAWASTDVMDFLRDATKKAVDMYRAQNPTAPLIVLDTEHIFDGHQLCEKGADGGINGVGKPQWGATGEHTDWIRRIGRTEAINLFGDGTDIYLPEPMHPMYWGQRALSQCTLAAIESDWATTQKVPCWALTGNLTDDREPPVGAILPPTVPFHSNDLGEISVDVKAPYVFWRGVANAGASQYDWRARCPKQEYGGSYEAVDARNGRISEFTLKVPDRSGVCTVEVMVNKQGVKSAWSSGFEVNTNEVSDECPTPREEKPANYDPSVTGMTAAKVGVQDRVKFRWHPEPRAQRCAKDYRLEYTQVNADEVPNESSQYTAIPGSDKPAFDSWFTDVVASVPNRDSKQLWWRSCTSVDCTPPSLMEQDWKPGPEPSPTPTPETKPPALTGVGVSNPTKCGLVKKKPCVTVRWAEPGFWHPDDQPGSWDLATVKIEASLQQDPWTTVAKDEKNNRQMYVEQEMKVGDPLYVRQCVKFPTVHTEWTCSDVTEGVVGTPAK